jgi:hypothetical protein
MACFLCLEILALRAQSTHVAEGRLLLECRRKCRVDTQDRSSLHDVRQSNGLHSGTIMVGTLQLTLDRKGIKPGVHAFGLRQLAGTGRALRKRA